MVNINAIKLLIQPCKNLMYNIVNAFNVYSNPVYFKISKFRATVNHFMGKGNDTLKFLKFPCKVCA